MDKGSLDRNQGFCAISIEVEMGVVNLLLVVTGIGGFWERRNDAGFFKVGLSSRGLRAMVTFLSLKKFNRVEGWTFLFRIGNC